MNHKTNHATYVIITICAIIIIGFIGMGISDAYKYADAKAWEHVETIKAGGLVTEVYRHSMSGDYKYRSYKAAFYDDDIEFLLRNYSDD